MHVVHLLIYILIFKTIIYQPTDANVLNAIKVFFTISSGKNNSQETIVPSSAANHTNTILQRIQRKISKRETGETIIKLCDDNELMTFLAELQLTNPESIVNLATQGELPVTCKQVSETLINVENYLKTCTIPNGRNLYLQLIKGVARFVDIMCEKETETKQAFMAHFPCLKQLHSDFENCYGPADWTEDIKKHDMCCAYRQITGCYFTKAAEVCGKKAARAMKKVVTSIINVVIPVHCTELFEPCVDNAAPNRGSPRFSPKKVKRYWSSH